MSIRVLGDLELSGVLRWKKNLSDFPANPQPYTLITKDGTPYFYTELVNGSGFFSWQPIGIKQASYLHVQGVASSLWTVTHNFNTDDFAYFVYDSNHNLMIADIQVIDLNTIKVDLSEAMTGTVVLFSLQYLNSTTISATQQLNLGSAVLTSNSGVLEVNNNPIAFTQHVDAQDAALGARIDNLISNTDPAAIDSLSEIVTAFHNADGDLNAAITSMSVTAASALAAEIARANASESTMQSALNIVSAAIATKADLSYVDTQLAAKANSSTLSSVATSGSYSDLSNKPTIPVVPANVSVFSNDAGYQTTAQVASAIASASASSAGNAANNFAVKTLTVSGDIMPAVSGVSSIGSPADKFHSIYTQELHIDANTLYVDGVPVIGSSANTIQITADLNQGLRLATTGTGQLILDSQTATTIQTNGLNADVLIQAGGSGSLARITSGTQVVLTAPIINIQGSESISGDLTVAGNMTVSGTTTAVNTTNMVVKDNIVTVNKGEAGSGVSLRYSGFEVDRGDLARQRLVWDETTGKWVAGQTSQEVALATEPFVTAAISASTSSVTVSSLGLGNVSNTSDANKPVSTAQAAAIALKADAATTYSKAQVDAAIAGATPSFSTLTGKPTTVSGFGITDVMTSTATQAALDLKANQATTYTRVETDSRIQAVVGAAPAALDTLAEIATQLASDESAAAALVTTVATKVDKVTGKGLSTEDFTTAEKTKLAAVSEETTAAIGVEATRATAAETTLVNALTAAVARITALENALLSITWSTSI